VNYRQSEPFEETRIFRVSCSGRGPFEVRTEDDTLLGAAGDETKAIWSAVLAADLMSRQGYRVRVIVKRSGTYFEEYVAKPSPAFGLDLPAS
jgi:hypothetical protein